MDATESTPPNWEATLLFSPSKARQQEALAKDWSYVSAWLARKYHPLPVPKFERNDETLKVLLGLAAVNEKADEEEELVGRVEGRALVEFGREEVSSFFFFFPLLLCFTDGFLSVVWKEKSFMCFDRLFSIMEIVYTREAFFYTKNKIKNLIGIKPKQPDSINTSIRKNLQSSLTATGTSDLLTHATTSVTLNTTTTSPTTLANTLLSLTTTLFSLQQTLSQTPHLNTSLLTHQTLLKTELQHLHSPAFTPSPNLPKQTAETARQTKTLVQKIGEYEERLRHLAGGISETALLETEAAGREMQGLVQRVRAVEQRIAAFEGLGTDRGEVRRVMQGLRMELEGWVRRRDGLFEGLVERRG